MLEDYYLNKKDKPQAFKELLTFAIFLFFVLL